MAGDVVRAVRFWTAALGSIGFKIAHCAALQSELALALQPALGCLVLLLDFAAHGLVAAKRCGQALHSLFTAGSFFRV